MPPRVVPVPWAPVHTGNKSNKFHTRLRACFCDLTMLSSAATAWYDISVDDSVPRSIAVAFMQALPHDVLVSILQNLDSGELARIAVTCSDLRRACVIVWPRRQVLVRVHSGERLHVTAHDPYLGIGATLRSPPAGMKTVKAVVVFDRHLVVACVEAVSSHVILYMYLPRSGRWRRLPPPSITSIAACQSIGDRYLIVVDNDGATMLYSLDDKLWHKCPSAPSPHRNGAAGVIRGRDRGRALIVCGGDTGEALVESGAKFDLKTKTWSSIAPMPEGREKMGSCVYKDRLVVAGGFIGEDLEDDTASCIAYDPASDTWNEIGDLACPRSNVSLFNLGGRLVADCGDEFLEYDDRVNQWAPSRLTARDRRSPGMTIALRAFMLGDIAWAHHKSKFPSKRSSPMHRRILSRRLRQR